MSQHHLFCLRFLRIIVAKCLYAIYKDLVFDEKTEHNRMCFFKYNQSEMHIIMSLICFMSGYRVHMHKDKAMFLYSPVSNPENSSKHYIFHPSADLFNPALTCRYPPMQLSELGQKSCLSFEVIARGFEHSSRQRVRHSNTCYCASQSRSSTVGRTWDSIKRTWVQINFLQLGQFCLLNVASVHSAV